jgi:6-pyruvoyltetrahydropterin/6-carboxytetrahydropterin synthase
MWELTKSFRFEAAHAISGTTLGANSEEIHGHSFRAEIAVRGKPDPRTGMLIDLGRLEQSLAEIRQLLDHKFLNNVAGLEKPTLEHLAAFIWDRAKAAGELTRVTVFRDSGSEACSYFGPQEKQEDRGA